jgi:hypothetical protein
MAVKKPWVIICSPKLSSTLAFPLIPFRSIFKEGICTQGRKQRPIRPKEASIPIIWVYFITIN